MRGAAVALIAFSAASAHAQVSVAVSGKKVTGTPGKDIFACGGGKDRVQSAGGDMVASSCEIVNGKQGSQTGGGGVGGGGAPLTANCRYVTKTV